MSFYVDSSVAAMAFVLLLLLLAVLGGILMEIIFLSPKNEGKYQGIAGGIYDFLTFRKLIFESILRFFYVLSACVVTAYGIIQLFLSQSLAWGVLGCLGYVIVGNLALRLAYEFLFMLVLLCRSVQEINQKLKRQVKRGSLYGEPKFSTSLVPESLRKKMKSLAKAAVSAEEENGGENEARQEEKHT